MSVRPGDLEGRKKVRVRLRRNLLFSEQRGEGRVYHVVKDPVTLNYFRLDEGQYFIVGLMDGSHTLDEIRQEYEKRFRPARLSLEELEAFAGQLLHGGLAQNESPRAGELLFERAQKQRRQARWAALLNPLCLKVPLLDPDRFLARLAPRVRFLFTLPALLLVAGLVVSALGLVATHWADFLARLPERRDFFSLPTLLGLWLAVGLVKVLHELGHGLCCKRYGGDVPEMGLLLLLFFPCLYCNVSDSWRLPGKWQRLAVSAAGIYVELLIAGLATFAWWLTDPAATVHHVCFGLMVVCGINTVLFNGNPLLRFDGYYLLSDWAEVPNLADTSRRALRASCLRLLGVAVPREPNPPAVRPGVLIAYALASLVYRWFVTLAGLYLLYVFLKPYKLGSLALILFAGTLAVMLGGPVVGAARALLRRGRLPDMKLSRLWLTGAGAALVGLVVCLVPFPVKVEGLAYVQVEPDRLEKVVVPETGGFLKELPVRDGQRVRAGDVLAVLTNPRLEIDLRVNEADQALRERQLTAQAAQLAEPGAADRQNAAVLQQVRFELDVLRQRHAVLQEQLDRLVLRAPRDGRVMGLPPAEGRGKWLEKGTELCQVGDDRALRAVLVVEPADHPLLTVGGQASVRIHGGGAHSFPGVVEEIAQVDAQAVPAPLSNHAGGEVPTQQDPVSRAEKPQAQRYLVAVRLHQGQAFIHPGVLGRVKIEAGQQTLWERFRRWLAAAWN